MDNQHYTMFKGLLRGKGHIIFNDEMLEIGKHCKVTFMMNPITDERGLNFGGGRVEQKLFKDSAIPQMFLENFSAPYAYCNLLRAPIYDQLTKDQQSHLTEQKFEKLCVNAITDYQTNKSTVRAVQEKVLHELAKELKLESYPYQVSQLKSNQFMSTGATNGVQLQLEQAIAVRSHQRKGLFQKSVSGQPGLVVEGQPGLCKSEMIRAVLAKKNIPVLSLDDFEKKRIENKQYCYKIDAGVSAEISKVIICKAFEEGNMVWIDEFNSVASDLEKVLNAAMTGVHPITGEVSVKQGFMFLGSINPAHMLGRQVVSHALESRYTYTKMPDISKYHREDLKAIVENMNQDKSLSENFVDELVNKFVSRKIANFRESKSIIEEMKRSESKDVSANSSSIPMYGGKRQIA